MGGEREENKSVEGCVVLNMSYIIESTALQAQYLPQKEERSVLIKVIIIGSVEGRSRSVIQDCVCDQDGRFFIYLGFSTLQVISQRVVGRTEGTST